MISFTNHVLDLVETHGLEIILPQNLPASIASDIVGASFTLLAATSSDSETRLSVTKEKLELAYYHLRMPVYVILKYHKEIGSIKKISSIRMKYCQLMYAKMVVQEKINRDPKHCVTFIRPSLEDIFDRGINRKAPDNVIKLRIWNEKATTAFGEVYFN